MSEAIKQRQVCHYDTCGGAGGSPHLGGQWGLVGRREGCRNEGSKGGSTRHVQGAVNMQSHWAESLSKGHGLRPITEHLSPQVLCREWGTPEDLVREALGPNSTGVGPLGGNLDGSLGSKRD